MAYDGARVTDWIGRGRARIVVGYSRVLITEQHGCGYNPIGGVDTDGKRTSRAILTSAGWIVVELGGWGAQQSPAE